MVLKYKYLLRISSLKSCILVIFTFLFQSCSSENYDAEKCQDLFFESYRGNPTSANKFKYKCEAVSIKYTKSTCQKAFKKMTKGSSRSTLESQFGKRVTECFTKKDLKLFLKN